MSLSLRLLTFCFLFSVFALALLSAHPRPISADATEAPTMVATGQGTLAAAVIPKPGHWEGTIKPSTGDSTGLSIAFDIGASQQVIQFKMVLPFKTASGTNTSCTFTEKDITLGITNGSLLGTHSLNKSADDFLSRIWNNLDWQPFPPPITKTSEGEMAEVTRITGTFTDPVTISGDYRYWGCRDQLNAHAHEGTWNATLKTLLQATSQPTTPAPTTAATLKATTEATSAATSGSVAMGQLVKGKEWAITVQAVENIGKSVESPGMNLNRRVVITAPEGKHLLQVTISLTQLNSKEIGSAFIQKQIVVRDRAGISYPYLDFTPQVV